MPTIDVHSHVLPPAVAEAVAADPTGFSARIEEGGSGEKRVAHDQGYAYPLFDEFLDAKQKYDEERESASTSITITH
jgi:aminocarboxymuconate-semialdehyde decarboxylase